MRTRPLQLRKLCSMGANCFDRKTVRKRTYIFALNRTSRRPSGVTVACSCVHSRFDQPEKGGSPPQLLWVPKRRPAVRGLSYKGALSVIGGRARAPLIHLQISRGTHRKAHVSLRECK